MPTGPSELAAELIRLRIFPVTVNGRRTLGFEGVTVFGPLILDPPFTTNPLIDH